mmetsp:Transcript_16312/g.48417  ORF Transcript_16312/g.48417 Transcript_16312/m.48417 type:complete len:201 (-) Transcript_16312:877-1479(-)
MSCASAQLSKLPSFGRTCTGSSPTSPDRSTAAAPSPSLSTPSGCRNPQAWNGRCGTASDAAWSAQWSRPHTAPNERANLQLPTRGAANVYVSCRVVSPSAVVACSPPPCRCRRCAISHEASWPIAPPIECPVTCSLATPAALPAGWSRSAAARSAASTLGSTAARSDAQPARKPRCSAMPAGSSSPDWPAKLASDAEHAW